MVKLLKKYRTSKSLASAVCDLLIMEGHQAQIEEDEERGTPIIASDATAQTFHRCVVRALITKTSTEAGFQFISENELKNTSHLMEIARMQNATCFAVSERMDENQKPFRKPNGDFVRAVLRIIRRTTKNLTENDDILQTGIPDDILIEQAKNERPNPRFPNPISTFDISPEQAGRITSVVLEGEAEQISEWFLNTKPGSRLAVYKNLKTRIGHGFCAGAGFSQSFPLSALAIVIRKDSENSMSVLSVEPCMSESEAGDVRRIILEHREQKNRHQTGNGRNGFARQRPSSRI